MARNNHYHRTSQAGEFALIDDLKRKFASPKDVLQSIGDDAAVVQASGHKRLVVTTDMIVEGVHFRHGTDWKLVGRKALACNISDIAAMGAVPRWAVVSIGVSKRLTNSNIQRIFNGIKELAVQFNTAVIGGDITESNKVVVNIALIGEAEKGSVTLRKGARAGDCICVTGPLGRAYKGRDHHLKFTPRLKESRYLVKHCKPTAMVDISDGLAADLGHILRASRVGAVLFEESIPKAREAALTHALYDGEDFELLFTLSPRDATRLKRARMKFYIIGEIVRARGIQLRTKSGKLKPVVIKGYTHF